MRAAETSKPTWLGNHHVHSTTPQVKTTDTDGYNAVQVGYRVTKERKLTKPEVGHLAKSNLPPMRKLREFKVYCLLKGVCRWGVIDAQWGMVLKVCC